MIAFWIVSACLIAGALLFLLPPVLQRSPARTPVAQAEANLAVYRAQLAELAADVAAGTLDHEQYESSRCELERRLLQDVQASPAADPAPAPTRRWPAVVLGATLPLTAVLLYLHLGSPALITAKHNSAQGGGPHAMDMQQIEQMVDGLARRLAANPQDPDGWIMLARSYTAMGRYAEANTAYARAVEQRPDDAQLLADYADTLAMLQGKQLAGAPAALIQRALRADPKNMKALALAGTEAYERRDYQRAGDYWERLLALAPPGTDLERSVQANVQEARALAASTPLPPAGPAAGTAAGGARVTGTVRLSRALAAKAAPNDTVFIFARALRGPRMPLAIVRHQVKDLPADFVLDDSLAMAAGLQLSAYTEVAVGARISRTGDAMPQPGDLQSVAQPVRVGATGVRIVIDGVVP